MTTQRITISNLETLCANISRRTGKQYHVGQIFGLYWSLAEQTNPQGGLREVLSMPTKAKLYDHMHSYFQGVRDSLERGI